MDASGLLDVWERSYALAPPLRALALLAHAHPALSRSELAALPLGRRDTLLRELRRHLFGDALAFVSSCPACSSVVESTLDLAEMPVDAPAGVPAALAFGDYSIVFRAPTLGDLVGLPDDPERARRTLAARCIADTDRERAAILPMRFPTKPLPHSARR